MHGSKSFRRVGSYASKKRLRQEAVSANHCHILIWYWIWISKTKGTNLGLQRVVRDTLKQSCWCMFVASLRRTLDRRGCAMITRLVKEPHASIWLGIAQAGTQDAVSYLKFECESNCERQMWMSKARRWKDRVTYSCLDAMRANLVHLLILSVHNSEIVQSKQTVKWMPYHVKLCESTRKGALRAGP